MTGPDRPVGSMSAMSWFGTTRDAPMASTWRGGHHRRYGKKRYGRRGRTAVTKAGALYNPCRLGGEKLFLDTINNAIAVDITPVIFTLNIIDLGAGSSARTGRRVEMNSLYLRISFALNSTQTPNITRYMVLYDKQTNGAAPVIADILETTRVEGHFNMDNRQRFEILLDKTFAIPLSVASVNSPVFRKHYIKMRCRDTIYTGTGSGVADIATGGLFIMFMNDRAAGVTAGLGEMNARLRYRA